MDSEKVGQVSPALMRDTVGVASRGDSGQAPAVAESLIPIELGPIELGDAVMQGCCDALPALRLSMDEAQGLAALFKAISHPVRLQIVDLLSRYGGQVCVCDIEGHFDLSQPTISHHLKILRQAGFVESENRGIWVYYHIRPDAVSRLQTLLGEFRHA
jgi:ArsR family transcriptional regulator